MESTNEERVELEQLRNRKFWCVLALIAGGGFLVMAAIGEADSVAVLIGLALLIVGGVVRSRAMNREQLIRARQRDRASQTVVGPHQGQ